MINGLQPYPEYKESGLPWVGTMPAHWLQRRMKFLFRERVQKGFPDEPLLAATQTKGVVRKEEYEARTVTAQKDFHLLKLVEPADFVISLRSFEGGIEVAHCRGIISPAYTILAPRPEARRTYFTWFFKSPNFIQSLSLFVTGIREGQNIDYERLSRAYMPLPPDDEQEVIGRFLDHANGRIERAIRAKKKLIALLNEQKEFITDRAVTRGIEATVPLKPSGVPCLGDIPKHWEAVPLKGICTIQSGVTLGKVYIGEHLTELPYLRVANVQAGRLDLSTVKTLRLPSGEATRSMLQKGDVLMTEGGDPDKLGRGCVWTGEISPCIHQNHVFAVRPARDRLRPHFLASLLASRYAKLYFLRSAKQTTNLASTSKTTIGQFRALLPSVDEQDAVLRGLEAELKPVTTAIHRAEREIELLREYRGRLIADVVTGKLDVRAVTRHLSAEADEPSALIPAKDLNDEAELEPSASDDET
jgi:type I restriction enzyme, S subunit